MQDKEHTEIEIEETLGLKSVDAFEELNLNADLLRGVYGTFLLIQPLVLKNHRSFNREAFFQLSAREIPLPKPNQEQERLPLSPLGCFK